MLLDLLRLTDRYESIGNTAAEESQMVGEDSNELDEHEPANLPLPERILNHLRSTECQMPVHYAVWAEEAGFDDLIDFSMALNRARVARLRTTASTLEPPP